MSLVKVSVKGQVVLPADIRRKLGIVGASRLGLKPAVRLP